MKSSRRIAGLIVAVAMVSGCMNTTGEGTVSRFLGVSPNVGAAPDERSPEAAARPAEASEIIEALQRRPSAIQPGTPFAEVAHAVIASDARVAEAELRVAQLRAEAAKRNWLPRIGPRISLNSLGDFVADLVIQQVLFDNGRKSAERDLAKANVEAAAVTLVEDGNRRVFEALSLYVTAEENRALRGHLSRNLEEMAHFEWTMQQRVTGGVSDLSDLNVLMQKNAAIRARITQAEEAAATAMAELDAMAVRPLSGLTGLGGLSASSAGEALGVIRARASRDQAIAEARIARAGHLPGLAANAATDGAAGLEVTTDSLFGLGTMAEFQAIEATKESAERKVTEAAQIAERQIAAETRQLAAYRRQTTEAKGLTTQAKRNLDIFRTQYEHGQRQVMDVVGTYETYAQALETEIALTYKTARAELELARLKGALAEGARL